MRGPDGAEFKTTKGAPQIIAKLCNADNIPELKMRVEAEVANLGARGIRSLAVARTKPGSLDEWEMLGMLTFLDPPRPDTKHTIEQVGCSRRVWLVAARVVAPSGASKQPSAGVSVALSCPLMLWCRPCALR